MNIFETIAREAIEAATKSAIRRYCDDSELYDELDDYEREDGE